MRNLIDEKNIGNVIKYFQYISAGTSFRQDQEHEIVGFYDWKYDFEDNYWLWERNKSHLFKLFGNKIKVTQELGEQNICTPSMVSNIRQEFLDNHGDKFNVLIKILINILSHKEIIENRLQQDICMLDVKLRKGWRITRCFAELESNKKELQKQQDIYSIFLQSLKMKGRLVLSIDPLDFITMSVSKSGWSSCHHPNSCHGLGGVAYMNDGASVIAYVETDDPMINYVVDPETKERTTIEMPNKIWRQIVTINKDHSYALQLKQYPNNNKIFSREVTKMMENLLMAEKGIEYHSVKEWLCDYSRNLQRNNCDLEGYMFYCDYYNENIEEYNVIMPKVYQNTEQLRALINTNETPTITVGDLVYCACGCGDLNYTNQFYVEEAGDDDYYYGSY